MSAKEPIEEPIDELIDRSSFGTPTVRSLSDRTSDEAIQRIIDRVRALEESTEHQEDSAQGPPAPAEHAPVHMEHAPAHAGQLYKLPVDWRAFEAPEYDTSRALAARLELTKALEQTELFGELDRDIRRALAARLTPMTLDRGENLFTEGEPAECAFVLIKGTIRTMIRSSRDELVDLTHHQAPAVFGELEFLDNGPRSFSAQVVEPATLVAIPRDEVLNLLQSDRRVADVMLRRLSRLLRRSNERKMELALQWRMAGQLLDPSRVTGPWSRGVLSSLADMVASETYNTPVYRCMMVLDIEGFARPNHGTRLTLRTALRDMLDQSLTGAGIDWLQVEFADFGGGAMMLFDPETSKTPLLDPLVLELSGRLARYNRTVPAAARLRLRCAVHAGEIHRDAHGFSGEDFDLVFRLLEAKVLRNRLARSSADLALIVSDPVFERVTACSDPQRDVVTYKQVRVKAKESTTRAWLGSPAEIENPESNTTLSGIK